MREVGAIDNELDASLFRDYLFNLGIESDVERGSSGDWKIWIHDEDRIDEAEKLLTAFLANPRDPSFEKGADGAEDKRLQQEEQDRAFARKLKTRQDLFRTYGFSGIGIVTLVLIALSVVITLLCNFGDNRSMTQFFAIAERFPTGDGGAVYYRHLTEVRNGQIWRLVTPMFIHFAILHLLFNMLWLRDLGSMVERIRGRRFMVLFVLAVGVTANIGQFYVSGPGFGGMSGVVYALLGYVWIQSRENPWSGFEIHSFTFQMMLVWFVLCLTGMMGAVANTVHAIGLIAGVAWGYWDARRALRG